MQHHNQQYKAIQEELRLDHQHRLTLEALRRQDQKYEAVVHMYKIRDQT